MSDARPPRVVAELGRPETPEETAERKARDRALRRSRQTFRNLLASLAATVALVAVIFFAVPRPSTPQQPAIDVASVAKNYEDTAGQPLIAPAVPASWRANAAELRGTGDAAYWYAGYVVGDQYAGLSEGLPGTSDLLSGAMDDARPTGTTTLDGTPFRVYDRRSLGDGAGNVAYGLTTRLGKVRLACYGTDRADVVRLAKASVAAARSRGLTGAAALP